MLGALNDIDRDLFQIVNQSLSNDVFDAVMPIITDLHQQPLFWAAVTAWIISQIFVSAYFNRDQTDPKKHFSVFAKAAAVKWVKAILILALSMGLADLISYRGIKVWVKRDRPEAAGLQPTLRTHPHSGWSFPSNHSANNFALARTVQFFAPSYALAAYIFAFVVAFSRVYVGVHFPADTLAGALIGYFSATLVWRVVGEISRRRKKTTTDAA
jgi:undecaprenyl-diphosphatase